MILTSLSLSRWQCDSEAESLNQMRRIEKDKIPLCKAVDKENIINFYANSGVERKSLFFLSLLMLLATDLRKIWAES